ncbi:MAG: transglycosylase domain-containing protein [Pseudonocardia sp.]
MPLLTHDETGAESIARNQRAMLVEDAEGEYVRRIGTGSARGAASVAWRRVRRALYTLLGIVVFGPALAFFIGWFLFDARSADDTAVTQVATFTFAEGTPFATVRPDNVNRVKITLDQVPENVREAVLAAEDRSFFSNPGFDISGIGRATWNQLQGGTGGGSTITQQYVKVSTGQDELSLWRKYKEVVLAAKISREQTKEEILENYLNLIYFGRGAYGIQAASQSYFGKDAKDLSISEGAMLAGIIQSPSRWDPEENPDKSVERWTFVLDGMVSQNWITPSERAAQRFPVWLPEPPAGGGIPGDDRGHVYNLAKAELEERGITEEQINTLGLTIQTTVDPARQKQAVGAVTKVLKGQPDNLRSALVSIDPRTGAIVAYYGGPNGVGNDYAKSLRQPGSSFKPFVLSAALQGPGGIGLGTTYDGSGPRDFPGGITVRNSEGSDPGEVTVKTAMTRSINTVFYQMALDVGPYRVVDAAHEAGIPYALLPQARGGIALGDQEVHPTDMASAFGTFAAGGVHREPYVVAKVTAADGRVLYDRADTPELDVPQVPPLVARNVIEAMLDVAGSSGFGLADGRPVAAKTGTVQHPTLTNQNKDAWTVGFTPSLSTAVWLGTDTSEPIQNSAGRPVFGRMLPGAIWKAYMSDALRDAEVEQFAKFVPMGDPLVTEIEDPDGSGESTTAPPFGFPSDDSTGSSGDEFEDGRTRDPGRSGDDELDFSEQPSSGFDPDEFSGGRPDQPGNNGR